DADALWHLEGVAAAVLKRRRGPVIITPHDGEFSLLDGASPAADRIASAQALANTLEVVVLLKGPTTVIASPASPAHVVSEGDVRLATAGTGDVLAGLIGALLAQGLEAQRAASAAAFVHGRAGRLGQSVGFIASDLPKLIPRALAELSASNTI
ncbi:MAG: ADP/ATP-dependent (S)-NAD(P)H-hydrate dehydratase, partial [Acidimicrobiales bacterium]